MSTVKFEDISRYFEQALYTKTQSLYDNNIISENLKYQVFTDSGEYFNASTNPQQNDVDRTILVSICNNGAIQDASVTIDTYVQMVSFEFFAREEQREDLVEVLTQFCAENKNKLTAFSTNAVQISISDFPEYSEKFEAAGFWKFNAFFNANLVVFQNAILSNLYVLNINGVDLLTNECVFSRVTTMEADLQKRNATLFFPNTTAFSIDAKGIYLNDDACQQLFNDCVLNSNFNVPYTVIIKKYSEDKSSFVTIRTLTCYCKSSVFRMLFGSLSSYAITLYEGLVN